MAKNESQKVRLDVLRNGSDPAKKYLCIIIYDTMKILWFAQFLPLPGLIVISFGYCIYNLLPENIHEYAGI